MVLFLIIISSLIAIGAGYLYSLYLKLIRLPEVPSNGWFGSGNPRQDNVEIKPFTVDIPEDTLMDLKARLTYSRFGHEVLEDENSFVYGCNVNYLKEVQEYWLNKFDWRKQEDILNSWPQFTTEIEGIDVHFYHVKPDENKYKKILPLLIVHGWPGCVFEFYKIIPMLTDPAAHNIGNGDFAFEVIAPSIPGFGFSTQPKKKGFSQLAAARVFKKLMERLGHKKYYLQGGDWGAIITNYFAKVYPESVLGLHINMLPLIPTNPKTLLYMIAGFIYPTALFAHKAHQKYNPLQNFIELTKEAGYFLIQATKPDTVGTALNDSPIGMAAYILEKFSAWTDPHNKKLADGGLTKKFTLDELLTVITIYWTQGNIVSSQRFYKEYTRDKHLIALESMYQSVPTGHVQSAKEIYDKEPAEVLSTMYNLKSQVVMQEGGHFAAFEEPQFIANDLFKFVSSLL